MKKITTILFVFIALTITLIYSCSSDKSDNNETPLPDPLPKGVFAKGADVGWLSQMEATGYQFFNDSLSTETTDCLQILKNKGINTIRLRVFVNPSSDKLKGHCSTDETIAMAIRAKELGMRIMIDFHYSDTFADPEHQAKPVAWANHSFPELLNDVYQHTYDVLSALKAEGITPEWVQIGNEIVDGMIWEDGRFKNWDQLQQLLEKGYEATKAIDKSIRVIIHTGNYDTILWFFGKAKAYNLKYDVIGVSYYPNLEDTSKAISELTSALNRASVRYNKEVMVVEIGGNHQRPKETGDMITDVIEAVKKVPDEKGLGVIYWEPQGAMSWSGYDKSAWIRIDDNSGYPSYALNSFKK